jgi:glycosyltransferase involved in cell wall biosynthesis
MSAPRYVLVTPAYNEERLIRDTIESILSQTVRPVEWVIVSDGSTDRTDEIVRSYAERFSFIRLVRVAEDHPHNFKARIHALNLGLTSLRSADYGFVGMLDADVSFGPDYFSTLLAQLCSDPRLAIAGGIVVEPGRGAPRRLPDEDRRTVANAAQLLRRSFYETIGELPMLPHGAPDTYVEITARMNGWEVRTFPELHVQHHRQTGSARGLIRGRFRQGRKDYSFGYLPDFEILKCIRRISETPFLWGSAARFAGYCWSALRRERPAVSKEFLDFLRNEQRLRVRRALQFSLVARADANR